MKKLLLMGLVLCLLPGCKAKGHGTRSSAQEQAQHKRAHKEQAERAPGEHPKGAAPKVTRDELHPGQILPSIIRTKKDPRAIIAAAVKRRGGEATLAAIRTARATHVVEGMPGARTRRVTLHFPHRLLLEVLEAKRVTRVTLVDGDKGYLLRPGKAPSPLDAATLGDLQRTLRCDPLQALVSGSRAGATLSYRGETRVGGQQVDEVQVMSGGHPVHLFIAREDGELLAYRHLTGAGQMTVVHSDFKELQGTRVAHTNTISVGGARVISRVTSLQLNPKLAPGTFDPGGYRFAR